MSVQAVREYLKQYGLDEKVMEFTQSSATVAEAARTVGVEEARIAKTLSFHSKEEGKCVLIVAAGDARVDNGKFKTVFGRKASMLTHEMALTLTGHAVGGVCPFALPDTAQVYLDDLLARRKDVTIDYIHGDDVARELAKAEKVTAVLMPDVSKETFFADIMEMGVLPRKTFSMGEAHEKRYYMECRTIE